MSNDRDDDGQGLGTDKVRKAMAGKKAPPKLGVIQGGKSEKPKRRSRKRKEEAEPQDSDEREDGPPVDPDDPGHDGADLPPDDEGRGIDDIGDAERVIVRFCEELDQNDRDNGRRLVAWFGEGLCYVTGLGWLVWRGTHWLRDEADLDVRLLAQMVVDKIKLEALVMEGTEGQKRLLRLAMELGRKSDEQLTASDRQVLVRAVQVRKDIATKRSKRRNWAVTSGNAGKTTAMLQQAQSLKSIPIERLDADALRFNLLNGTLRFWTDLDPERPEGDESRKAGFFEFLPHDRSDMITKIAEVSYDADATCPFFLDQFLAKVQPDPIDRKYLQVTTAYALLVGGNDEQRMIYHYGTGANGKSAFIELFGRLAGAYRSIASPETVTGDGQRQGQQANPDIARLHNTRLVTIEELPKNVPLREELIKALTGGTKILARFLNKDFFEFMPQFVPVLSGNAKPNINGGDYGIWRRLLPVIWGVTIPEGERIAPSLLAERLDAERPGILNWLIDGLMDYLKYGLDPFIPPKVREFWNDYREERDNVGVFVKVALAEKIGSTVQAGKIYEAYTRWCEVNAMRPATFRSFGDSLAEKGFKKKRGNYVVYLDVELLPTASKFDAGAPQIKAPKPEAGDPGWSPTDLR